MSKKQTDGNKVPTDNESKNSADENGDINLGKEETNAKIPRKKTVEQLSQKLTMNEERKKDLDLLASRLGVKKTVYRTNQATVISVERQNTLSKPSDPFFPRIEKAIKNYKPLKAILNLVIFYALVNLMLIIFIIGLNLWISMSSSFYGSFLDLYNNITKTSVILKSYYGHLLRDISLARNHIVQSRYAPIFATDPSSNLSNLNLRGFIMQVRDRQTNDIEYYTKTILDTSLDASMEKLMSEYKEFKLNMEFASNYSTFSSWTLLNGPIIQTAAIMFRISKQKEIDYANNVFVQSPVDRQLINYMANYNSRNIELMDELLYTRQTQIYFTRINQIQYVVYALIAFILILLGLSVAGLIAIMRRYERIHRTFSILSAKEIEERGMQLQVVLNQMEKTIENVYYVCDTLYEMYSFPVDEKDQMKTTVVPMRSKSSKTLFAGIQISVILTSIIYLILSVICLAALFVISSKAKQLSWIDDKRLLAQQIVIKYPDYLNQLTLAFIYNSTFQYEGQPYATFFTDFDVKLENSMKLTSKLASKITSNSDSEDTDLMEYIDKLYSNSICPVVEESLQKICESIDSGYATKGLVQVESRMTNFLKEAYFKHFVQKKPPTAFLNDPSYAEAEFSITNIYLPVFGTLFDRIYSAKSSFVKSSVPSSLLAFTLTMVALIVLNSILSVVLFYNFNRTTRVVHFSFLLISLQTYINNFQLKQALMDTLKVREKN